MWQIIHLVIERFEIRSAVSYWIVNILCVAYKFSILYEFIILQDINSIFLTKFK